MSRALSTARSWLPASFAVQLSQTSSTHPSGWAPYPTTSPRHHVSSTRGLEMSASTASRAGSLAWMSLRTASRIGERPIVGAMRFAGAPRDVWRRSAAFRLDRLRGRDGRRRRVAVAALRPRRAADHARPRLGELLLRPGRARAGSRLPWRPARWLGYGSLALQLFVGIALAVGRPRAVRRLFDRLGRAPAARRGRGGRPRLSPGHDLATLPTSIAGARASRRLRAFDPVARLVVRRSSGRRWRSCCRWSRSARLLLAALVRRFPRGWWIPARSEPARWAPPSPSSGPSSSLRRFNDFERLPDGSPLRKRGARARRASRRRHRGGLQGRRQPPFDDAERLRRRPRPDQARRPLRQPDRHGAPRRAALGRRPRARPRRPRRRPPRGPLRLPRRPARAAVRAGARAAPWPGAAGSSSAPRLRCPRCCSRSASRRSSSAFRATSSHARSRRSADAFALRLTDDPAAFIRVQQQFVRRNLSDPSPPAGSQFLFGTHPTGLQRVGSAVAFEGRR